MSNFNPLSAAKAVLADTDLADPDAIADAVLAQTPKGQVRSAYRLLLRDVARYAIRLERMDARTDSPEGQTYRSAHPESALGEQTRRQPNRSSKVAAIRAHWKQTRYYVAGEWRMLATFTADEVLELVAQRRDIAARNNAEADRLEQIARQMKDTGAVTVADLPDEAVAA